MLMTECTGHEVPGTIFTLVWRLSCIDPFMAYFSCNMSERLSTGSPTVKFSPLCIRSWHNKLSDPVNDFPQVLHMNAFSPVCNRRCFIKGALVANVFIQVSHLKGL